MNYFALASAAERYARGRPYFHRLATARIAAVTGPVARGLDVACGTGLSTRALAEIAETVVGTDLAVDMLAQAEAHPRITYLAAPAEDLPLADAAFDLVTVCQAFHWFDQARFLAEAHRLLRSGGWLALYNDGTKGTMVGNDAYADWTRNAYLKRYPAPPRAERTLSAERARQSGFEPVAHDEFIREEAATLDGWTRYLITQSNVIAATDAGSEDIAAATAWIRDGLRPLFRNESETFLFGCTIDVFRKAG